LPRANTAAGAELPGRRSDRDLHKVDEDGPSFHALNRDQVRALLEESAKPPAKREGVRKNKKRWSYSPPGDRNRWHALWHLLANGGLRTSEAQALKWEEDVDWKRGRVRVNKALVESLGRGESWRLEPPKTERSRRTVELPPETMEALRWHQMQQEAEKNRSRQGVPGSRLCLRWAARNPARSQERQAAALSPAPRSSQAPPCSSVRPKAHALYAAPRAGVPVHVVSQRMGHALAKMTLDVYANYLPGAAPGGHDSVSGLCRGVAPATPRKTAALRSPEDFPSLGLCLPSRWACRRPTS
jgi:integrase